MFCHKCLCCQQARSLPNLASVGHSSGFSPVPMKSRTMYPTTLWKVQIILSPPLIDECCGQSRVLAELDTLYVLSTERRETWGVAGAITLLIIGKSISTEWKAELPWGTTEGDGGCRIPTKHLERPNRRPREKQVSIRRPLRYLWFDRSFLRVHLFVDSVCHHYILKTPFFFFKTNLIVKPVSVRNEQLVQKRKTQTCVTNAAFGGKGRQTELKMVVKERSQKARGGFYTGGIVTQIS